MVVFGSWGLVYGAGDFLTAIEDDNFVSLAHGWFRVVGQSGFFADVVGVEFENAEVFLMVDLFSDDDKVIAFVSNEFDARRIVSLMNGTGKVEYTFVIKVEESAFGIFPMEGVVSWGCGHSGFGIRAGANKEKDEKGKLFHIVGL